MSSISSSTRPKISTAFQQISFSITSAGRGSRRVKGGKPLRPLPCPLFSQSTYLRGVCQLSRFDDLHNQLLDDRPFVLAKTRLELAGLRIRIADRLTRTLLPTNSHSICHYSPFGCQRHRSVPLTAIMLHSDPSSL